MRIELHDFEVTPICFLTNAEKDIKIKPINQRFRFWVEKDYVIDVLESQKAENTRFPGTNATKSFNLKMEDDGCLHIRTSFEREGMYHLRLRENGGSAYAEFRVYALENDMRGRYPFIGDLHMHTCRSDGREDPFEVASDYRANGYDFTVISDHHRYYPSLEARQWLKIDENDNSPITDMLIVPGEEVHLPLNDVHYVNFGGKFSVNALVVPSPNEEKGGDDKKFRSLNGICPDPITAEQYMAMIRERAANVDRELESERLSYAALTWEYEQVQKAGGLAIFPHPYWLCNSMQLSEDFTEYIYKKKPFDAFEVLGGESYFQHNGFQTAFYYDMRVKGYDYPVVGSTDSHGSTEHNRNAMICQTIVFASENKTNALISAIKEKYSVAIDTISPEYRVVGDFRWVKFASFLLENWFPLHDKLAKAEGEYLLEYAKGNDSALDVLKSMKGQLPAKMRRFFEMD